MSTILRPPGPVTRIPGRSLIAMQRDRLGFVCALARDYGDIAHVTLGPRHIYLVCRPDDIRDVLVTHHRNFHKARGLERAKLLLGNGLLTSEDEFHLRQRRLAQPAFHKQRIAQYAETMVAYGARARERWHEGETRDVARDMNALTLAIVGKTLFDADVEAEAKSIGQALTDSLELFNIALLPFSELFDWLLVRRVTRFRRARELLDATIYRMIRERRASGEDRGDLLSMLLAAHDTEGFLQAELAQRRTPPYPPLVALANLVVSGADEAAVGHRAAQVADWCSALVTRYGLPLEVLGPAPCPLARIKERWRWHVLLKGPSPTVGRVVRYGARRLTRAGDVRVVIDRDPVSVL